MDNWIRLAGMSIELETGPSEPGGAGGASAPPIFCNYLLFKFSRKHCKAIL